MRSKAGCSTVEHEHLESFVRLCRRLPRCRHTTLAPDPEAPPKRDGTLAARSRHAQGTVAARHACVTGPVGAAPADVSRWTYRRNTFETPRTEANHVFGRVTLFVTSNDAPRDAFRFSRDASRDALYDAIERRRVAPFEVAITVLVRGNSRQDVRDRSKKIERRVRHMGGKLNVLRWEQAAGLQQLDPAQTKTLRGRSHLIETGTLARTYPWSDSYLQMDGGVVWGEAGQRPCLFTPFCSTNKGPHMCWYGTTNAGKGTGAHMLWSRLHLIRGIRLFGIDQDEQHEHCGRFLEYLGGRKLTPRDAQDAAAIELHRDDGVVILDLSEVHESDVGPIFAAWTRVIKRHMLANPGREDRLRRRGGHRE